MKAISTVIKLTLVSSFILLIMCQTLDPFLFYGKDLDEYKFDSYTGETECTSALDYLGKLDTNLIHEFSIKSGKETISSVLISNKTTFDSTDTVILYFHGNSTNIDYYWPRTRLIADVGLSNGIATMVIDYRGYGKSTGTPTEEGIFEDGYASLRYLKDSLGNPNIIVYAFSLGSLVGCETVSNDTTGKIKMFILEAPIGSLQTLVEDGSYLDLPGSYLTTFKSDNTQKIKRVQVPLLWFHGTKDETLPLETNGRAIYNNYIGPEAFSHIVNGGGHANLPTLIGYKNYIQMLKDFIYGNSASNALLTKKE